MTTQEKLIQIVQQALEIEGVNPVDRFEELGGNSLILAEVLSQAKKSFGVAPPPRLFFDDEKSTMAALAAVIDQGLALTDNNGQEPER